MSRLHSQCIEHVDPEAISSVISHASFDLRALTGGCFRLAIEQLDLGGMTLDHGRQSLPILARGAMPSHTISFGLVDDEAGPAWINGRIAERDGIQIYPAGSALLYRSHGPSAWVALQVAESLLADAAERHLGRALALPSGMVHQPVAAAAAASLRAGIRACLAAAAGTPLEPAARCWWRDRLLRQLVLALAGADPARAAAPDLGGLDCVGRALAVLVQHLGEDLSLAAVGDAVGLSTRRVQQRFQGILGLSPGAWLRIERLTQARRELLAARGQEVSVAAVARRWGFSHLGRFAIAYRQLFGERPSDTATWA